MKRLVLLFFFLLAFPSLGFGETQNPITLDVNYQTIYCDVPPVMVNDRVFVPLRAALEATGGKVIWDPDKQAAAIIKNPYNPITVIVDSWEVPVGMTFKLEGTISKLRLERPPFILDGRMMVPIRPIAEHFGQTVEWIESQQIVRIQPRHKSWVSEVVDVKGKLVVKVATEIGFGSGWISDGFQWGGDGIRETPLRVHTCYHVIENASTIKIKAFNGKWYQAKVDYISPEKDYAILSVSGLNNELGNVSLECDRYDARPFDIEVGEEIVIIGHPLGLENSVSTGIISAIRQPLSVTGPALYQVTAPISPGSSGAPVFDKKGGLIGYVIATMKEGQLNNFVVGIF